MSIAMDNERISNGEPAHPFSYRSTRTAALSGQWNAFLNFPNSGFFFRGTPTLYDFIHYAAFALSLKR